MIRLFLALRISRVLILFHRVFARRIYSSFLRKFQFDYLVVDEGHTLKVRCLREACPTQSAAAL